MAGICCGVVADGESSSPIDATLRSSRRRTIDMLPSIFISDAAVPPPEDSRKRQKLDSSPDSDENCDSSELEEEHQQKEKTESEVDDSSDNSDDVVSNPVTVTSEIMENEVVEECQKFGVTSVCGRRRDMEDSVTVCPSFFQENKRNFHYFGVFDGHGCSHVATRCSERLHEIVKEEIEGAREGNRQWKATMENGFARMDDEVLSWNQSNYTSPCRCELQTPHCDAVGSTAVDAVVTPDKVIVSNCGDSRAVLCRNGVAIPLSSDHKPDRPDELNRVEEAGGRVIFWDVPRVLGMLAMSRAIGDNYLKPYVISEPEVTVTERSDDDECLIIASDGLWDVVSNETACGVVRMCLRSQNPPSPPWSPASDMAADGSDKACSDASILLTKLALARHTEDNVSVVVVDLRKEQRQSEGY